MKNPEIPQEELTLLVLTVGDAFGNAREGHVSHGYRLLWDGLSRTKRARDRQEAWAENLEEQWQRALDEFRARYPLP